MADETVNYRAKSIVVSKTMIFNVLAALGAFLGSDQLKQLMGPEALAYTTTAMAVINMILRFGTVRPVAMIPPGQTAPVAVAKLPA